MKKIYLISLLASLFALSACSSDSAYTDSSASERINFDSMLPGAQVFVDGNFIGRTPCSALLSVNNTYDIKFEREFFKPESYTLSPTLAQALSQTDALVRGKCEKTLSEKNVYVEMKPDCLAIVPGETAFEAYTENYLKIEALKREGVISKIEYEYIVNYMHEFYSQD